jgi:hypothetical protein
MQNYQSVPNDAYQTPKKSKKTLWIVLAAALLLACLCCVIVVGVLIATGIGQSYIERPGVTSTLTTFMKDMAARNVEGAFAVFSPRAQRQMAKEDLKAMVNGSKYALFEGFQSLTIEDLTISAVANANPDVAQGTVAEVTGKVTYSDGYTGEYTATLEKVDGTWKLHIFDVTVSPGQ